MLAQILEKTSRRKEYLIPILQAVQKEYRYLPKEVLREVCRQTDITPADVAGVSTFYDQFRHTPAGEHTLCVCTGTACHVKGADKILDAFRQTLNISEGQDTDSDKKFTILKVACLGCCTLAPVVQIDGITYGHLTTALVPEVLADFNGRIVSRGGLPPQNTPQTAAANRIAKVKIGLGSCCQAQGSAAVYAEVRKVIDKYALDIAVEPVGCVGMCHQTPLLEAVLKNGISVFYAKVKPEDVQDILLHSYKAKNRWQALKHKVCQCIEKVWSDEFTLREQVPVANSTFLQPQKHLAMEHCGEMNPTDLDDYKSHGGFEPLKHIISGKICSAEIIETLKRSGLRGRGGAGFPTFKKWEAVLSTSAADKFIVCNGDEGDPGAFMDRMLLESFPFRIIEGMGIAGYTAGAKQGYFYIRAEYPLAVERIRKAIDICYANGLLGKDILGTDFCFDLSVKEGAGAFVCGEETALLESMEGRRGMPRLRPPFPAQSGLFGQPTLINNVETLAQIPFIFKPAGKTGGSPGVEEFAKYGTERSKGTKVFALAGKVNRGGLIEVPMGIPLRKVVENIGGVSHFKAVQIGGPSGGCVPEQLADTPVDYESLSKVGAIMGSGGLVVLNRDDCMVDIARYFLQFTQEQSCGKCTFCRVGTRRMLDILNRLCSGEGEPGDIEKLEHLAEQVKAGSLCGLGKTAPNPVLSTLKYFRDEYEAHIEKRCPAGKCTALITYRITDECNGCSICSRVCPVEAIAAVPYRKHTIDTAKCTKCDACRTACPHGAVER